MPAEVRTRVGPRRLLVSLYVQFVVAAGARSAVQLSTGPDEAMPAYLLSAVAAGVYAVGLALVVAVGRGVGRALASAWCVVELVAVVTVATIGQLRPFADDTVWSDFGAGYLYVPLLLPIGVLVWLARAGEVAEHRRLPER